jgi:hypothetical protein
MCEVYNTHGKDEKYIQNSSYKILREETDWET